MSEMNLIDVVNLIRAEIARTEIGDVKRITGPQGERGPQGEQGIQGPQGPRGNDGAQGPAGAKGNQGKKGDKGVKGDDGADGVGIARVEQDLDNAIIVYLTDGNYYTIEMPIIQDDGSLAKEVHFKSGGGSGGGGVVDLSGYVRRPGPDLRDGRWLAYREDGSAKEWAPITTDMVETNSNVVFRDTSGKFKSVKDLPTLSNQLEVNRFLWAEIEANTESIDTINSGGYDDTGIKADLAQEIQDRIDGDANLQGQIDGLDAYDDSQIQADLAKETQDRKDGDADLQGQINDLKKLHEAPELPPDRLPIYAEDEPTEYPHAEDGDPNDLVAGDQWYQVTDPNFDYNNPDPEGLDLFVWTDVGGGSFEWVLVEPPVEYVKKEGGDSMQGPLNMKQTPGTGSRDSRRINTLGVYSNEGNSYLGIGTDSTKIYVGQDAVTVMPPIKVNEIVERIDDQGVKFGHKVVLKEEGTEDSHAVTKGYIDGADSHLQAEIEQIALGLETLLTQRTHGKWKYVGFTGDNVPRNAGEFALASDDLSAQDNIITINLTDLNGTTIGLSDVKVGDYIEIVDDDEPANYALFSCTKEPEGTGISNIEVALKDKGNNFLVGDTCEIRFFAINDQNIELTELDDRFVNATGDTMTGALEVPAIKLTGNKEIQEGTTPRIKFNNKVEIPRVGDNKHGFTILGRNNTQLIQTYHNPDGSKDMVSYYGDQREGSANIATVKFVEDALESAGGGGVYDYYWNQDTRYAFTGQYLIRKNSYPKEDGDWSIADIDNNYLGNLSHLKDVARIGVLPPWGMQDFKAGYTGKIIFARDSWTDTKPIAVFDVITMDLTSQYFQWYVRLMWCQDGLLVKDLDGKGMTPCQGAVYRESTRASAPAPDQTTGESDVNND